MLDLLLNESVFLGLLIAAAAATVLTALILSRLRPARREAMGLTRGRRITIALAGPVLLGSWFAYNGVIAVFDLDSVLALAINASLFALLGVAAGLSWRWTGP